VCVIVREVLSRPVCNLASPSYLPTFLPSSLPPLDSARARVPTRRAGSSSNTYSSSSGTPSFWPRREQMPRRDGESAGGRGAWSGGRDGGRGGGGGGGRGGDRGVVLMRLYPFFFGVWKCLFDLFLTGKERTKMEVNKSVFGVCRQLGSSTARPHARTHRARKRDRYAHTDEAEMQEREKEGNGRRRKRNARERERREMQEREKEEKCKRERKKGNA